MIRFVPIAAACLVAITLSSSAEAARHPTFDADSYLAVSPYVQRHAFDERAVPTEAEPSQTLTGGPVGGLPDKN